MRLIRKNYKSFPTTSRWLNLFGHKSAPDPLHLWRLMIPRYFLYFFNRLWLLYHIFLVIFDQLLKLPLKPLVFFLKQPLCLFLIFLFIIRHSHTLMFITYDRKHIEHFYAIIVILRWR